MSEEEIRSKMEFLQRLLTTWAMQIQAISDHEAQGAWLRQPHPFSNPEMTATKNDLIRESERVLEAMEKLHKMLVGKS